MIVFQSGRYFLMSSASTGTTKSLSTRQELQIDIEIP